MPPPATLTPDERQTAILALLRDKGRLPVAGLAERFATSEDSVRRDLRALASAGRIRRVHGAVLPAPSPLADFERREADDSAAKADIARYAASLLRDGTTVLFDGGTTTLAVARALGPERTLTVVTTCPPVALALADRPGIEVILVGGRLDRVSRTVVGSPAVDAVRAVRADLCVIGLCSIDADAGVTAAGFEEAQVKRAMIESAAEVVAVATADKLGTASAHLVAPAGRIDRLVTDRSAPADRLERLRAAGLDILLA